MIRRITTKEEQEEKEKKNKRILAIIIGLVMLFSSASYAFFSFDNSTTKKEKLVFSGIDFIKNENGLWDFTANGQSFQTTFNPAQVSNVSFILGKTLQDFYNKNLYFGINSAEDLVSLGTSEILQNIGRFVIISQPSCLSENCSEDYPVKNCSLDNVLIFKPANFSRIYLEDNCTIIAYAAGDEQKAADAFIFGIFGIRA